MSSGPPTIRPATVRDVPAMNAIRNHYVLHTVMSFGLTPVPEADALTKFDATKAEGYPYLVSVDSEGEVLGFSSVSAYREGLGAYVHTAELSLFCAPGATGRGVGTALLCRLLELLRSKPGEVGEEWIASSRLADEKRVLQVLAVMAVDETGPRGGYGLKEYYERHGFVEVGYLRRVGFKKGRWVDTMFLQLSLD